MGVVIETNHAGASKAFLGDLETLGTTVGRAADELREDDDAADQDMNNDFAESPARRKLVFKA